jgi:MFS family permease
MMNGTEASCKENNKTIPHGKIVSNMILLLMGRMVSLFGTHIYNFAISLYVLKTTGSGTSFALAMFFGMIPRVVFSPFVGVISDKINRKKMVVIMDFLSGIVIISLFILATIDSLKIPYIYAASFLLSTCNTFFDIPFMASIPNIVDDKNLMRLNSLNQSITSISAIGGPFLGGIIYAFVNIKLFLIMNGVSFIVSGITEIFIDFNLNKSEGNENSDLNKESNFITQFIEGFRFLKSQTSIFILFLFCIFLNFLVSLGMHVPYPYIINEVIKLDSKQFGVLEAVVPAGMLLASLVFAVLPEGKKKYKKIIVGISVISLCMIFIGIPVIPKLMIYSKLKYIIYYIFILFIIGVSIVTINIPVEVTMQRLVPDELRGRVWGLIGTMTGASIPLAMILSGILVDCIPVYLIPICTGILLIFLTMFMVLNKNIQKL